MPMPDFFNSDAFNSISLTAGINRIPNNYGLLRAMNLFPADPVSTRTIAVEEVNGVLNLLPTRPVGAPGTVGISEKRKVRSFIIPFIPHDDVVLPEEVQNARAFGSENMLESQASLMARKLATMRNKHAITLEHLRMGALKGIILDADGSTLYNLYTEFDITPKVINFALTTTTTEVLNKVLELKDYVETNLKGEIMTRVHVLCSSSFFQAFVTHGSVKDAYKYFQQTQKLSTDDRGGFEFAGVVFQQYLGSATDAAGNVRKFIADDQAHAFPLGTTDTFRTHFAPGDFNEAANTLGLELYAKQEPRKFGRGWDLHTQSSPLPICRRPEILVKLTKS